MARKKTPQKKPEAKREFTLTELRAAAVARFNEIYGDDAEKITPDSHARQATKALVQFREAIQVENPTDPLIVQRLLVNAYLRLDLAAHAASVNMNEAIPLIFNEEGEKIDSSVELEYLLEDPDD